MHEMFYWNEITKKSFYLLNFPANTYLQVHYILFFFRIFKNIPDFFCFPSVLVCVRTQGRCQCVYTHKAGRKPTLQQNWQSSEKSQSFKEKTQFLMNTLYNQQQPSAGEGEVANFRKFLEKTQYLMNTLYIFIQSF